LISCLRSWNSLPSRVSSWAPSCSASAKTARFFLRHVVGDRLLQRLHLRLELSGRRVAAVRIAEQRADRLVLLPGVLHPRLVDPPERRIENLLLCHRVHLELVRHLVHQRLAGLAVGARRLLEALEHVAHLLVVVPDDLGDLHRVLRRQDSGARRRKVMPSVAPALLTQRRMGDVDWARVLLPDTPIAEIVVRGTLTYLALFVLLRVTLKRQTGSIGITNLLTLVLIADAAQNAMADDYHSIPDGVVLVATIIFWSWFLDWLGYRVPRLQRFVHPPPLPLVKNGRLLRRNMRDELLTEDELMSQLRLQGVADLGEVREALIEGDGRISVVKHTTEVSPPTDRRVA
jgi:uncharacterized membrane protein YcaP (DUF421 family)